MKRPPEICLLDLTLPTAAEDLALDEALLLAAEAGTGGEVLRFWERPQYTVVLGSGGTFQRDVVSEACAAGGVPVQRRSSGGGTVLLGPGCLCFSLILAYDRDPALREIPSSYELILGRIGEALGRLGKDVAIAGTSDLSCQGWKVSGNSQQRKRTHLLHHGTLLYDFDLTLLSRYLHSPERQPDYRLGRSHDDFVHNLPFSAVNLREALCQTWGAAEILEAWPHDLVARLTAEKYTSPEWIHRR